MTPIPVQPTVPPAPETSFRLAVAAERLFDLLFPDAALAMHTFGLALLERWRQDLPCSLVEEALAVYDRIAEEKDLSLAMLTKGDARTYLRRLALHIAAHNADVAERGHPIHDEDKIVRVEIVTRRRGNRCEFELRLTAFDQRGVPARVATGGEGRPSR